MAAAVCSSSLQQCACHTILKGSGTGQITARSRASATGFGRARSVVGIQGAAGLFLNGNTKWAFHAQVMRHAIRTPLRRTSERPGLGVRAMDASIGGEGMVQEEEEEAYGPPQVFPRVNVRDVYKRLGVSRDASEEEIREARNYLATQYGGHERSREAIEAAYDKIIMESFRDRRKSKINLKTSLKKKLAESPPWVRAFTNRVEVPTSQVILQRFALFFLLGVWSVMNPADGGPAFQVAVSLAACIYFLNDRLKSLGRAFMLGFGSLIVGWISGSFLLPVVSNYILPTSWSLELSTALFSYIFLWVACTFLK
ncbi:hypothetical protein R1sor_015430 [Riccia sorocarpa]|uniref:Chaperone DnaJ-domain superfamily protein n=1 Tax=Riccia sorocarpa TaxID=122646 RepID=A0ABD3HE64_9MARC